MKNEIIGVHENGTVAVRLPATKKGNVCLDTSSFEKVWRMPEQNANDLILYQSEERTITKPWIGLVVQIDGKLYRLVRVIRAKKEGYEFDKKAKAKEIMKKNAFEYAGIFVPSQKWVENMEIVWGGERND